MQFFCIKLWEKLLIVGQVEEGNNGFYPDLTAFCTSLTYCVVFVRSRLVLMYARFLGSASTATTWRLIAATTTVYIPMLDPRSANKKVWFCKSKKSLPRKVAFLNTDRTFTTLSTIGSSQAPNSSMRVEMRSLFFMQSPALIPAIQIALALSR